MIDFICTKAVPAVYQNHFFRKTGKQQCIRYGRIATADHHNGLSFVEHTVTGRTVMKALSCQGFFFRQPQFPGTGTGSIHHGFSQEGSFAGFHPLGFCQKIQRFYFRIFGFGTKPFCPLLHLDAQGKAVNALRETGIVIDLMGQRHLTAGR